MIINQATLQGIYNEFNTLFQQAFAGVTPSWMRIAMRVPSGARKNSYTWLGAIPKMREWIGERFIKNLKTYLYELSNQDWELTIEVDRNDIEDDAIGLYNPMVQMMGASVATHPDEIVFALLPGGFTALAYDGQFFFDTDHPVGSGTVSNHGGGSGTAWYLLDTSRPVKPLIYQDRRAPNFVARANPSDESVWNHKKYEFGTDSRDTAGYAFWQMAFASKQPLNPTNFGAAMEAMMSFKDDYDKPLGIMPTLLVVPPSLIELARRLLNADIIDATTNPWRNAVDLHVSPWLA
jgi:phage major head subunit gpT-like protein